MPDVLTPEQRKFNMSQIRGANTKPELILRKALWGKGIRYRIKNRLPGRPDIVFPRHRLAVFVDGCFWHKCPKHFVEPDTNRKFWREKISGNVKRDKINTKKIKLMKWKVIRIWEHEIKKDLDFICDYYEKCLNETLKDLEFLLASL